MFKYDLHAMHTSKHAHIERDTSLTSPESTHAGVEILTSWVTLGPRPDETLTQTLTQQWKLSWKTQALPLSALS